MSHKDEQDTDDTPRAEDGATADPETPTMASLPSPLTEADYAAIEAAVMETARGRWFLGEYARRNRNSDTAEVLDAIERLERIVGERRAAEVVDADRLRLDLIDMAAAITRTREEIAAMSSDPRTDSRIGAATESLDAVVEATETATSEILSAAETVQEVAWTLREQGVDTEACDKLDANAVEIYTLCSFQDLTGQRIQKVVQTLRYLEQRIDAMMRIWHVGDDDRPAARPESEPDADARLLNGPALPGEGIDQGEVDMLLDDMPFVASEPSSAGVQDWPDEAEPSPEQPTIPVGDRVEPPAIEWTPETAEPTPVAVAGEAGADVFGPSPPGADYRGLTPEERLALFS